ncbi:MAG TPA: hypothetical protein VJ901_20875 [Thermoanaerobaculia bacterium]|nr:hypothetical protein [Thermoanaerobaculia bacterium]
MKGFIARLAIAIGISYGVWWLFVTPLPRMPLTLSQLELVLRVISFPVAVTGEMFYPLHGVVLVLSMGSEWHDFYTFREHFQAHMLLATATYLFVLYVPQMLHRLRGNRRLVRRIVIGFLTYAGFAAIFCALSSADAATNLVIVAKGFLILACAATIAWSNASMRWKIGGVLAVMLTGVWAFAELMRILELTS